MSAPAGTVVDLLLDVETSATMLLAKDAVGLLQPVIIMSSTQLAELLETTPAMVDIALAPLVDQRRLTRADVLRAGDPQFDYRRSSAWKPAPGDFRVCIGATERPAWRMSTIAPPTPTNLVPGAPTMLPTARRAKPTAVADVPAPAPAKALAAIEESATVSLQEAWSLGIGPVSDYITSYREGTAESTTPMAPVLAQALDRSTAPNRLEATDPVCAVNSRGELAIDLGDGDVITFPPAQTLALRRFLIGCAFLEAA